MVTSCLRAARRRCGPGRAPASAGSPRVAQADHAAEREPLRMIASAGEAPHARDAIAAIDGDHLADRWIRTERDRIGIRPALILCLFGIGRDQPLMNDTEAEHPARGTAAGSDRGNDWDQCLEAVFVAAIDRRLHDAKQPGFTHLRDSLARYCRRFRLRSARPRTSAPISVARATNSPMLGLDLAFRLMIDIAPSLGFPELHYAGRPTGARCKNRESDIELVIAERCDAANAGKSRRDKREHERRVADFLMRLCLVSDNAFSGLIQFNALPVRAAHYVAVNHSFSVSSCLTGQAALLPTSSGCCWGGWGWSE